MKDQEIKALKDLVVELAQQMNQKRDNTQQVVENDSILRAKLTTISFLN